MKKRITVVEDVPSSPGPYPCFPTIQEGGISWVEVVRERPAAPPIGGWLCKVRGEVTEGEIVEEYGGGVYRLQKDGW